MYILAYQFFFKYCKSVTVLLLNCVVGTWRVHCIYTGVYGKDGIRKKTNLVWI